MQINGSFNSTKYYTEIMACRRSLAAVPGWTGPLMNSSIHFVEHQLHTPHIATDYGIHDSINVTRMLPWHTKAPDFKNIECMKSSEAPTEIEIESQPIA